MRLTKIQWSTACIVMNCGSEYRGRLPKTVLLHGASVQPEPVSSFRLLKVCLKQHTLWDLF